MEKVSDFKGRNFKWMMYVCDIITLIAVFSFIAIYIVPAFGWRNYDSDFRFYRDRFGHLFVLIMSYILASFIFRMKTKELKSNIDTVMRSLIIIVFAHVFFSISIYILYRTFPGHLIMLSAVFCSVLMPSFHLLIRAGLIRQRHKKSRTISVVFVGADNSNVTLYSQIISEFSIFSYAVKGFFTTTLKENIPNGVAYLGSLSDVCDYLKNHDVTEVYCSLNPAMEKERIDRIAKTCEDGFVRFYYVPNMEGYPKRKMTFFRYGDVNLVNLRDEPLSNPYNRFIKRCFDIIVSATFLITLFPIVWLILAIIIKITSPGPVLFKQTRTGYNGKPFTCLKFRSMKVNLDADKIQASKNDPRKTKFGDFLRRTSLDELPQFINVFKGEMSVVGPRPHMEVQTKMYSELISEYMVRHQCIPGITGWAQINGCRGETKTVEEMAERVKHDIWYIENWSVILDIRIIIKTVLQILSNDKQAY